MQFDHPVAFTQHFNWIDTSPCFPVVISTENKCLYFLFLYCTQAFIINSHRPDMTEIHVLLKRCKISSKGYETLLNRWSALKETNFLLWEGKQKVEELPIPNVYLFTLTSYQRRRNIISRWIDVGMTLSQRCVLACKYPKAPFLLILFLFCLWNANTINMVRKALEVWTRLYFKICK